MELKHALTLSKPKLVFCSEKTIEKMTSVLIDNSYIQNLVLFGNNKYSHGQIVYFNDIIKGKIL